MNQILCIFSWSGEETEVFMGYRIIAINREFESAGSEIAQAAATRLGLPYYDKFLIEHAAEQVGIDASLVAATEEKLASRFEYSQAEAAFFYTTEESPLPTGARVAEVQFELIKKLAEEGPCVIVGRCANYVLQDRDDVLDIFVHAGLDYRLERTMASLNLPKRKALRVLRRTDKARKAYYNNYTGLDWNDMDLYHMILNPDKLSIDTCVDVICSLYQS